MEHKRTGARGGMSHVACRMSLLKHNQIYLWWWAQAQARAQAVLVVWLIKLVWFGWV